MKKVYSMILIAFFGISVASAQRTIDWSVDEIIEPTEINSSAESGTAVTVTAALKNNGTDDVVAGDTILMQIAILNANNQAVVIAPAQRSFYVMVADRTIASGDTVHMTRSFSFGLYPTVSQNVTVRVVSALLKSDITTETTPGTENNLLDKAVVWFNPQGWGVSIEDVVAGNGVDVSPNPASDVVNVSWAIAAAGGEETVLNIMGLDGKVIRQEVLEGAGSAKVNISELESGVYFFEVRSGSFTSTKKILVD